MISSWLVHFYQSSNVLEIFDFLVFFQFFLENEIHSFCVLTRLIISILFVHFVFSFHNSCSVFYYYIFLFLYFDMRYIISYYLFIVLIKLLIPRV